LRLWIGGRDGGNITKISDNFTLLRLILALLVVFSHSYALDGRPQPMIFGNTAGGFAVDCFFVISGYLVVGRYQTTERPELFAWKRFWRINPALVLAVPVSLLLSKSQDHFAGNPTLEFANGSLWTLSWEGLLYILVLFLGMARMLTAPVVSGALLTGSILLFSHLHALSPTANMIAPFFLLFTAGAMIRLAEDQIDLVRCGLLACAILMLGFSPVSKHLFEAARAQPPRKRQRPLFPRNRDLDRERCVQCRERLGGLLRYYHQEAA